MSSNDYNKVTLIGRLTRDADLKYTTTGTAIAGISLANNRSVKKQDNWETEVSYFDGNIYGRMAENLKPYLTKGKMILIAGHLKQDCWEKDGQKFSRISIVANSVQLLGGRTDGGQSSNSFAGGASGGFQLSNDFGQPAANSMPDFGNDSFGMSGGDFPEDIPF